jgi:hypothetical protein
VIVLIYIAFNEKDYRNMKTSLLSGVIKSMLGKKAALTQYVFKKNDQEIYFQEMVHVADKKVYEQVNQEIKNFLNLHPEGKIYLEGIHGDEEDGKVLNDKLMSIIGVKQPEGAYYLFLKELYKTIAYVTRLQAQDNTNYLKNIPEDKWVKADMTFKELYEQIKHSEETPIEKRSEFDPKASTYDLLHKLWFPGFLFKHVLRAVALKKREISLFSPDLPALKDVGKVILHDRNQIILNFIKNSSDKKIFLTYGAAHLKEVKELLIQEGYTFKTVKDIEY